MGILDTPGVSKATAFQLFEPVNRRGAALPGYPVADNCYATGAGTAQTATGTSRCPHTVAVDCTDIRLVYGNWFNNGTVASPNFNDADNSATLTIKASVEVAGTIYRVTFKGATTATIDPGGMVVSDPLPIDLTKGTLFYTRTHVSGTQWYFTKSSYQSSGSGGFVATTDLTAPGSGAVADSIANLYTPMAITGTPSAGSYAPSVVVVGDSIANGLGDKDIFAGYNATQPTVSGGGFIQRALHGNTGFVTVAISGDKASIFATNPGHFRRLTFASAATTMICEYGRNDMAGSAVATLQADLATIWNYGVKRGMKVIQTTITPQVTTVDAYTTLSGQTVAHAPTEAKRVELNTWLRDGAPMTAGVAVATGTVGALRAGDLGHPLKAVYDATSYAESSLNSGLWKVVGSRQVTDGAVTAASTAFTSATAAFTSADVLRYIYIPGAGAGGAGLTTQISSVQSATAVTLFNAASTTVSGATVSIGTRYTGDGLHPNSIGATDMAAAVDLTKLA